MAAQSMSTGHWKPRAGVAAAALLAGLAQPSVAFSDETCQSPYMAKITGEEEFVYVWTVGVEGLGDGSDKLVTVDVRTGSPTFGQVIDVDSVGGRHEAHHGGLTDDRRHLWLAGLDTSQIFIFDVASDPRTRAWSTPSTTSSRRRAGWSGRTASTPCRGG